MSPPLTLSRRHLRAFHLAGTVPLPSPFPEVGRLSLRSSVPTGDGTAASSPQDMLVLEHVQSHRLTVVRYVRLEDVTAVLFCPPGAALDAAEENWFFGGEIGPEVAARAGDPARQTGIAYVRESAPVLMQVEVGMTAAESAEYYPPVLGERSDAHYELGCGSQATPAWGCGSHMMHQWGCSGGCGGAKS